MDAPASSREASEESSFTGERKPGEEEGRMREKKGRRGNMKDKKEN